jgi:hypothetical protein
MVSIDEGRKRRGSVVYVVVEKVLTNGGKGTNDIDIVNLIHDCTLGASHDHKTRVC